MACCRWNFLDARDAVSITILDTNVGAYGISPKAAAQVDSWFYHEVVLVVEAVAPEVIAEVSTVDVEVQISVIVVVGKCYPFSISIDVDTQIILGEGKTAT